ncbi:MAG: 30S ribosomal protein S14 [Gammaproteobacteria bacterium]|nr:30S ribosomal protein S14 [Gammaproteobacteria bacterium]MDH4315419.1 30S ribosomal protein S14 [Gammaproteobacteria bacterium]MDH5212665.1 30S ribosomal protein S14 [Gammaproteobacteria bacterium]
MAKTSMLMREVKRKKLEKQHAKKRAALKAIVRDLNASDAQKVAAQAKLNALPRDSAKSRQRNRCAITGRPHGVYRKFGLARNKLREAAMKGEIPGLTKASW